MSFLAIIQRPKYKTVAVNFDGTNDDGTRGANLTGSADSAQMTAIFSFDFTGGDGTRDIFIQNTSAKVNIERNATNNIRILLKDSANTTITELLSTTTYIASTGWKTILFSKSGTTLHLYEADTNVADTPITNTTGDIDYTTADWVIGRQQSGGFLLEANFADFWFDDSYIDLSVEANRRKFVDANSRPVYKGDDGSVPTGTAPLVFLRRGIGDTADSFLTNKGTGGGFTVSGALSDSTNGNPTD